jgi:hypothetical protein
LVFSFYFVIALKNSLNSKKIFLAKNYSYQTKNWTLTKQKSLISYKKFDFFHIKFFAEQKVDFYQAKNLHLSKNFGIKQIFLIKVKVQHLKLFPCQKIDSFLTKKSYINKKILHQRKFFSYTNKILHSIDPLLVFPNQTPSLHCCTFSQQTQTL